MDPRIRKKESPWEQAFWANYILVLHAIAAVAISIFMMRVIDGITVGFNAGEPWFRRTHLQADDITTAVSAAMVVIRITTGAWTAQSAWRCAFILLETQGITLRQFNRMISWPVYFLRGSTDAAIATLILLLLVPANLVAPVITGSVGWREVVLQDSPVPFQHTGPARTNSAWYSYSARMGSHLGDFLLLGISRAQIGWMDVGKYNPRSSRLVTTSRQRKPAKSEVDNLTLPFLEIQRISWDNISDVSEAITDELPYGGSISGLTLTGERPFNSWFSGNAVLFDEYLQENYPRSETNESGWEATVPSPTVFRGTKKIALLVLRRPWGVDICSSLGDTIFGNATSMVNFMDPSLYGISVDENCFFIGTVYFTAGVIRKRAKYITERVVEAEADSPVSIEDNNWVIESLYLLPDVMPKVALANASQIPTWDNLDGYVEALIRISYQAAWGQLTDWYNDAPLNLTAHISGRGLQAVVSLPRVIGWYCAQFLVLVSAMLLWMLQKRSDRPLIVDTGVAALLVDAAPVLNKYDATQELSKMSYVNGSDGGGKVQLSQCDVSGSGEQVQPLASGHYDSSGGETAPLAVQGEPNTGVAKPPKRFMLVPRAGDS